MKIEWHRVTPLSKIVALALFVALPFFGFWWGIQYGEALQSVKDLGRNIAVGAAGTAEGYYADVASWQTDRNNAGFSIAYPIDFDFQDAYAPKPAAGWRTGAAPGELGVALFTLTIPRALLPQTNFADGKLTVSRGANAAATADCMAPDAGGGPGGTTSSIMLGGVPFTAFGSSGAGAGNYYETTSYRTLRNGTCWAVEYTIHSTQIANYPASYQLQPFDKSYVADILDRIAGTFRFTE